MNANVHRQLSQRKRRITRRIENEPGVGRHRPMMAASNIHSMISDRMRVLAPAGRINGRCDRIVRATFAIGSSRERITRSVHSPRKFPARHGRFFVFPEPPELLPQEIRPHRPQVVLRQLRQLDRLLARLPGRFRKHHRERFRTGS